MQHVALPQVVGWLAGWRPVVGSWARARQTIVDLGACLPIQPAVHLFVGGGAGGVAVRASKPAGCQLAASKREQLQLSSPAGWAVPG